MFLFFILIFLNAFCISIIKTIPNIILSWRNARIQNTFERGIEEGMRVEGVNSDQSILVEKFKKKKL